MKKHLSIFLLLLSFVFSVSAQNNDARKVTEFGIIPCGEFMAEMDSVFRNFIKLSDTKIYVIYYGQRFIKDTIVSDEGVIKKIILKYPHRENGLNYARSVPLYLTSEYMSKAFNRKIDEEQIILSDGGFREEKELEIWFVPKNGELPKPNPTIDEKNIKFRKNNPKPTPDYTKCYGYN